MKHVFTVTALVCCSIFTTSAQATELDTDWNIILGASIWQTEGKGNLKAPEYNGYHLDLPNTNKNTNAMAFFTLEHPNRFLPNIQITSNAIEQDASGTLAINLLPFPVNAQGTIDLSHTDLTLYYRPANNSIMNLDIGVSVRSLYGTLDITFPDFGQRSSSDLSATLPMLYGNLLLKLPLGFSAAITANAGDDGKESSHDISTHLSYESPIGLGVRAGYRSLSTSLDSEAKSTLGTVDITADIDIKGPFATLFYHF